MRCAVFFLIASAALQAQTFEVTAIKTSDPARVADGATMRVSIKPGRWIADAVTAADIVRFAYGVRENEISITPGWAKAERYDIDAKLPTEKVTPDELRAMLQAMLSDRFQMKSHREVRQLPVYELVVAKGGTKVRETPDGIPAAAPRGSRLTVAGLPISAFAAMLPDYVERRVIDKTGLSGTYYFRLEWNIRANPDEPPAPSIFTAVQEQLGLKLEAAKGPVETIVIDRVDRPSAN